MVKSVSDMEVTSPCVAAAPVVQTPEPPIQYSGDWGGIRTRDGGGANPAALDHLATQSWLRAMGRLLLDGGPPHLLSRRANRFFPRRYLRFCRELSRLSPAGVADAIAGVAALPDPLDEVQPNHLR